MAGLIDTSHARIDVTTLPVIQAAPKQIKKVFQELLRNALIYHAKGRTPEVLVTAEETDDNWKFSVADNGIGVKPGSAERIFDVLKRLVKDKEYPGTGMGLAIAKKIVHRHRGDIWVKSQQHTGVIFCLTVSKGLRNE